MDIYLLKVTNTLDTFFQNNFLYYVDTRIKLFSDNNRLWPPVEPAGQPLQFDRIKL